MVIDKPIQTTQLPDAIIEDIADMLQGFGGSNDAARVTDERRACPRIPMHKCMAVVPYQPGSAGQPVHVWVSDISAGGLGLIHSGPMQPDDQFVIRLPLPDDDELPMLCLVVRCIQIGDNLYSIGSRFLQPFCGTSLDEQE
jgi:hypothetical protein